MNDNNKSGDWSDLGFHVLAEIKRLNNGHDNLAERLAENSQILSKNTGQLEIHIEGVRLAREQNDMLKTEMLARLAPLEKRSANFDGAWKLVGILAAAIAFLVSAAKLAELIAGHVK